MPDRNSAPQFSTPEKVQQICETMQKVETARASDRATIDNLANGGRPYTPDEVKKYQIKFNINWGFLAEKIRTATSQINNAFIPQGNFFTCHSKRGEPSKKQEFSQKFTTNINNILKRGRSGKKHLYILRSRNASVSVHGIGPLNWTRKYRLLPKYVPLEDLLIPTDTALDLSNNLSEFCINLYLTAGELYRMGCLKPHDSDWNETAIRGILKDLKDESGQLAIKADAGDWYDRPEAITEIVKQNSGYLESDAAPKVKLRAFYHQDPETQKWYRKIILRQGTPSVEPLKEFIYDGKEPFADHIDEILHCQFGDNSLVAPLKYHSVRGIGTLLYPPAETLNRLTCQAVQHVFQNLMTWFKINDPTDRDRLKQIILSQYGVMPEGASIVPQNERHQIDPKLLEFGVAQMRQNIAENSTSFTQGVDSGTRKEMTAFEAKARLQSSNAMVSNVLQMMYAQEIFYYEELVRRSLLKGTDDPNAKKFQEACKRDGIPDELMVQDNWRLVPERVLGAGDGTLAQAQADALMSQIQGFEPDQQRKIRRMWTGVTLDDPDRAEDLVPEEPDQSTSGTRAAEDVYGTVMRGAVIPIRKGIDQVGYCATLLQMMEGEIQQILQSDGMGTPEQINGFVAVAGTVEQVLQFLAQDVQNKATVKQLNDQLSKALNEVKGMAERHAEAMGQQQQQPDPEAMAKAEATTMLAQVKAQISQMNTALKQQQSQAKFQQKMSQDAEKHRQQLLAQQEKTQVELQTKGMQTGAELESQALRTAADLREQAVKTAADVEATKKKAEARPKPAAE